VKTTERNGKVVAALQVTEEADVMVITSHGKIIRVRANEIREAGRSTQGVRLLRLEGDDRVVAAAGIYASEEVTRKVGKEVAEEAASSEADRTETEEEETQ